MSRPPASRLRLALLIAGGILPWPGSLQSPIAPDTGLDASWQLAPGHAREHRPALGRDIVFTHGPWGWPSAASCHPSQYWPRFARELIAKAALFVAVNATGNPQHLGGHGAEAAVFAFHYFAGSPLHPLFSEAAMTVGAAVIWAAIKVSIMGAAILPAGGPVRNVLPALVAVDLGNSLLLGAGRYHTGPPAALSSRYQYSELLLCMLPFCRRPLFWPSFGPATTGPKP